MTSWKLKAIALFFSLLVCSVKLFSLNWHELIEMSWGSAYNELQDYANDLASRNRTDSRATLNLLIAIYNDAISLNSQYPPTPDSLSIRVPSMGFVAHGQPRNIKWEIMGQLPVGKALDYIQSIVDHTGRPFRPRFDRDGSIVRYQFPAEIEDLLYLFENYKKAKLLMPKPTPSSRNSSVASTDMQDDFLDVGNGYKYKGDMSGMGTVRYVNGDRYEGSIEKGRPQGGWYYYENGEKIWSWVDDEGNWKTRDN